MDNDSALRIKSYLEFAYDIPFDVDQTFHFNDVWFKVKPKNSNKELFVVDVKLKNDIRLVIEVIPEKYAALSIQDMANAPLERKKLFAEYGRQLIERKARVEFYINDIPCDVATPGTWPKTWKNYKLRVSRSPFCAEDEVFDEAEIASSWVKIVTGMFLSLLDVVSVEDGDHIEGGLKRIEVNRYERNPVNRELCLAAHGYVCRICGFDFEKTYGKIGHHFVHVHHIVPVSKMTEAYVLDPVNDLIPVCPNCHAMLHKYDPPLSPEELRAEMQKIHKVSSDKNLEEDIRND